MEIEFFEPKAPQQSMPLDPASVAKTFTESMPPDSQMLFASSEGIPENDNPTPQPRETEPMIG